MTGKKDEKGSGTRGNSGKRDPSVHEKRKKGSPAREGGVRKKPETQDKSSRWKGEAKSGGAHKKTGWLLTSE